MEEKKESFKHVLAGDYPTDYSTHANFVLFDYDKFDKWLGRLEDAHEREVREHTLEYDIDGLSDRELAEHGLVRLPVDADGVRWTGDETEFITQVGKVIDIDSFFYHAKSGRWAINGHTLIGQIESYNPSLCRHVTEKPDDPHKELADELEVKASTAPYDEAGWRDYVRDIADRLREMGGADADAKR